MAKRGKSGEDSDDDAPDDTDDLEDPLEFEAWRVRELARATRERDEAQDRNECIVCMERPRAVLLVCEPPRVCNHLLVCTTCAAALAECPNCRATITTRITVANSS